MVIKESLVSKKQYNGKIQRCVFIDGSVHSFPVAEVHLDTPYFSGHTEAVVIDGPLYPVIISSIQGVKKLGTLQNGKEICSTIKDTARREHYDQSGLDDKNNDSILQAVVTRGQINKEKTNLKPLKVLQQEQPGINRKELVKLQKADLTLQRCYGFAESGDRKSSGKDKVSWFKVVDGVLTRYYESPRESQGDVII